MQAADKKQANHAAAMEYVRCNLCGADDAAHLYDMPDVHFHPDEMFTVVQCRKCSLAYLNPRPTQAAMDRYYPTGFYHDFDAQKDHHMQRYEREAQYVLRHSRVKAGRHLDVGCANGDFPRVMKAKGWTVEGLEISSAARAIDDFPVHRTVLPALPVDTPTYDAVTSWAVFEHVHDPDAYFAKVARILKPGGIFAFLVTNVDSPSSHSLYREDLPRHTYFYNRRTISEYLRRHGLTLLEARSDRDIYEMKPVGWLRYALNRMMGRPKLSWAQLSYGRADWLRERGLQPSAVNSFRFALAHPVIVLDRLVAPLYERWQIVTGTYGITTYVARKDP